MEEEILCFNRRILEKYPNTPRLFYNESLWNEILDNLESVPRSIAEESNNYKQLVVYILIKSGEFYLTYRRTEKSEEKKLRKKYSIGIGGHVNVADRGQLSLFKSNYKKSIDFILQAVWREINEEINIEAGRVKDPYIVCFINDDSDVVGWRHFGITWLLEIREPFVKSRKGKGIGKLEFRNLKQIRENESEFERWSQLLIEFLWRGGLKSRC
jgi:predicted NUDIX family phosphoesterase